MTQELVRLKEIASAHGELSDESGFAGVSFVPETEDKPAHYRIGLIARPGKRSFLRVEMLLPLKENWNHCFLGQGIGGLGGYIPSEQLLHNMERGYATAASDLGTSKGRTCGVGNPDVWKDFGWRGNHMMTVIAKAILTAFYGTPQNYAYFVGGSTGGQQGMSLAQRFPLDYQGIVAGVPAHDRVALHTYFLWNYNHLRSKTGKPLFTMAEIERITELAVEYARTQNCAQFNDNFVTNPRYDADTLAGLISYITVNVPLDVKRARRLYEVYRGPINSRTGEQIFDGMPMGSEVYFLGLPIAFEEICPHDYPFVWVFGKDFDTASFDFDKDYAKLRKTLSPDLDANNPDLTPFYEAGGKLIMQSGAADSCVPFHGTVKYLHQVQKIMGKEKMDEFLRYYLYPGKGHSTEGRGCNLWYGGTLENGEDATAYDELGLLRLWVEKGIAPDKMTAARIEEGKTVFTRLISPYSL